MLSHSLNVNGWHCSTTVSFICIGHTSCFPEVLQKTPDCESTWRFSFRKVNRELSLSVFYQLWFKICFHDLHSLLNSILFSIHLGENSVLCRWYSWKWNRNLCYFKNFRNSKSGNNLLAYPVFATWSRYGDIIVIYMVKSLHTGRPLPFLQVFLL